MVHSFRNAPYRAERIAALGVCLLSPLTNKTSKETEGFVVGWVPAFVKR